MRVILAGQPGDGGNRGHMRVYKSTTYSHPICGSSDYPGSPDYVGVIAVHSTIQPS
jgi:hypothetical protein